MNQDDNRTAGEKKSPKPKKLYQKPAFRYERVFETMALACGKISDTQVGCHSRRKRS
jgi:hypothetical protein